MPEYNGYGVIWDVDGTLVDTGEMHFASWVQLAKDHGKPFTRQMFKDTFGRRNPEIIAEVFGTHYTPEEVSAMGYSKEEYYRASAKHGVDLLPGVRPLLEALHEAGFKQAIGSSAPRQNVDLILDLTKAHRYFEAIVTMEDTTRGKPDPQVFLVGAEKLSLAPEKCLVMEDAVAGIEAAHAGGMKAIGISFVGHHPEQTLKEAGAELVVKTLAEVSVETVRTILK
ncbi:MAG: HAD family phosphatase [Chloroflexota bacterium]